MLWEFAGEGNCLTFFSIVRDLMGEGRWRELFRGFAWSWFMPLREAYEATVAAAGFSEFEVVELVRDHAFPTAEAMVRWIDQPCIVPFLAALPEGGAPGLSRRGGAPHAREGTEAGRHLLRVVQAHPGLCDEVTGADARAPA